MNNDDYAGVTDRIKASFDKQNAMTLIKASVEVVQPGMVEIHVPHWQGVEQQHGFIHGGVVGMIADSAGGYAAMTLAPDDTSVLTVEYKINMLKPAKGDKLIARGHVVRAGRSLTITSVEVFACAGSEETLCALMQQTIMAVTGKVEK